MDYLRNRTDSNLKRLISTEGSKLAYKHHLWASTSSTLTIEEFWKKEMERIDWNAQLETSVEEIIQFLKAQERQWSASVLTYLPRGHIFNTTVYLIGGYDNIVYGEDVALNLNFKKFQTDHREAAYYLIHELAHAGYFRYRPMPDLARLRTMTDLLEAVKLLTHLEGMGVVSPFKLRMKEHGLFDDDYKVLLNENERRARVPRILHIVIKTQEGSEPKTVQRRLPDSGPLQCGTKAPMVHRGRPHGVENRRTIRNSNIAENCEKRSRDVLQNIRGDRNSRGSEECLVGLWEVSRKDFLKRSSRRGRRRLSRVP